jgi:septal ring factor EnvC (AmiA/AmiB activator)
MPEIGPQLWVGLIGGAVGLLTAIVAVWKTAVAARGKRAKAAEESTATHVQTALSALLTDADKSRDYVMARLDSQETRLASLTAQLEAARDSLRELRAENMALKAQLAVTEERARIRDVAAKEAEAREAASRRELDEMRRAIDSIPGSVRPPLPRKR